MAAQHRGSTKNRWVLLFKLVNYMAYGLYSVTLLESNVCALALE